MNSVKDLRINFCTPENSRGQGLRVSGTFSGVKVHREFNLEWNYSKNFERNAKVISGRKAMTRANLNFDQCI